jgi:prolipoprotein diacylglyceryltransferase
MIIVFPLYLAVPLIAPPRPFASNGALGTLLNFDRSHDSAAGAFPSYHVIWAFLAAGVMGGKLWQRRVWQLWAVLVAASCVTTGMHALTDVLAGLLVVWVVIRMERVWSFLRNLSEAIANSWREWRIGPVRVINHGGYAAAGVFLGIWILDTLLGPGKSVIPVVIFLGGTIGAALWAQFIEGSPALLRPLGFYGGVIGTSVGGVAAAWLSGASIWQVLGALVVAGPWIQGIGRLRCLVQGCCHGRPTSEHLGIRYEHPRSRVCRIASLRGVPIHPTPLYSLLWNVAIALVVTRLYLLHTTAAMVGGVYLILSGIGRFVEEAYRGEPQTPVLWGLRLYRVSGCRDHDFENTSHTRAGPPPFFCLGCIRLRHRSVVRQWRRLSRVEPEICAAELGHPNRILHTHSSGISMANRRSWNPDHCRLAG